MKLYRLLAEGGVTARVPYEIEIGGVSLDSRKVRAGDLFLALRGAKDDGSKYVGEALAKGAAAVLTEGFAFGAEPSDNVIVYPGLRAKMGNLFDAWYGHPTRGMLTVGVTGTNGKSTITKLSASLMKAAGHKVIALGTINYEIDGEAMPSDLTTPGPDALFKMLRQGVDQGCDALAMEASSHALDQGRIRGVTFARAIFTNLTRDHMDYHKDFEDYFEAKKKLFTEYLEEDGVALLNVDSPYGARLAGELPCKKLTFSLGEAGSPPADVTLVDSRMSLSGTELSVSYQGATHRFHSRLVGKINLENLLAAITLGFSLNRPPEVIARGIADVTVSGRNQVFGLSNGAFAVVDYAHTPDALERVLASLRPLTKGRLACLFGCGGDRDRTKRPIMGGIAVDLSDRIFLTSDNPRTEDAHAILEEILAGMKDRARVTVEPDRRAAIAKALESLGAGDCLLIAGKGHEDYQIIGKEKTHFSDQEEIGAWMGKRGQGGP